MTKKYINIDPDELSQALCRDVFGKFACKGKLPKMQENKFGVHVFYGRDGSSKQGHILFTFVTQDDVKVQIDFNVTEYVADMGYLDRVVDDMQEMMNKHRECRSPIVLQHNVLPQAISEVCH